MKQARTEEAKRKLQEIIETLAIPCTEIHVNGIRVNGYIQFSEMEAILEQLDS